VKYYYFSVEDDDDAAIALSDLETQFVFHHNGYWYFASSEYETEEPEAWTANGYVKPNLIIEKHYDAAFRAAREADFRHK